MRYAVTCCQLLLCRADVTKQIDLIEKCFIV
jgi:hypothetical protein